MAVGELTLKNKEDISLTEHQLGHFNYDIAAALSSVTILQERRNRDSTKTKKGGMSRWGLAAPSSISCPGRIQ
jgi:hypothetical protein